MQADLPAVRFLSFLQRTLIIINGTARIHEQEKTTRRKETPQENPPDEGEET
jgi:hypothetical protein